MITKKIKYMLAASMIVAVLFACSEMNDLHEPYLKDGETIYVGRALDPISYSGRYRLKLSWDINADPKITKALVKWRDTEDHEIEFPVAAVNGKMEQLIENLQEGGYSFDIYMLGDNGERSIKVQTAAVIYGEKYESRLFNRTISSIVKTPGATTTKANITWGPLTSGMRWTTLKYPGRDGTEKVRYIPSSQTTAITIDDHKLKQTIDGKDVFATFSYSTSFRPVQNLTYKGAKTVVDAIDTLNASFTTGVFPN